LSHDPHDGPHDGSVRNGTVNGHPGREVSGGAGGEGVAPRVAVVCVTWNRKNDVANQLGALARQTYPRDRMDVIVVDNASTDGTLEHLAGTWRPERVVQNATSMAHEPNFGPPAPPPRPDGAREGEPNAGGWGSFTIVRNASNMGGCGGFNTGFGYVDQRIGRDGRGDVGFVWLVDDDAEAPPDALEQLTKAAAADEKIGLVGSRTVSILDRKTTIETTIYYDVVKGSMSDEPPEHHPLHASHRAWIARVGGTKGEREFHGCRDVDVVSACSMLARWSAAKKVGFWDYRYFIYCDDADWCLRFAAAGYRVVLNLDAVILHTPWNLKLTPARIYYAQRNAVWMAQKVVPFVPGLRGLRRGLKRVTGGWMKTLLKDAVRAATHRRLFHADIIRRTADDIATGTWGKTGSDGPASEPVIEALARTGALSGAGDGGGGGAGARVAIMCTTPPMLGAARELRRHVKEQVAARGMGEREPAWVEVVRDGLPEPTDPDGALTPPAQRVVFGHTLKSRIFRQKSLILKRPRAVVVFDQTNDMPLVTGRWNVHIDMKKPGAAQLERDGVLARAKFGVRWLRSLARCGWYALRVRPFDKAHDYGWRPESVVPGGGASRGALSRAGAAAAPVPPGWSVSERPMNVAILGWARLSAQQWEGSGYNWSASELARGLVMSGHAVSYLQSGMTYRLSGGWAGPRVAHRERWGGVECYDLMNSPNLSPASSNFQNMRVEMSCPEQTRIVLAWLDRVGAQVVHIHSLEGYGLDIIQAIKKAGRAVVVTPHNYWYVCPQVDLLHQETRVCMDYDGGKRCVGCLPSIPPGKMKRKRRVGQTLERILGIYTADVVRKTIYGVKPAARSVLKGKLPRPEPLPRLNPDWLVDPELAHGFAYTAPLPQHPSNSEPAAPHERGEMVHDLTVKEKERAKPFDAAPPDANERIVANRDRHLVVLNEYGERRQAGVAALNAADFVIPPSDFLRRLHVSMGVDEARTRWVRLGQPHFDQINRRARRSPYYDARPWDPASATRPLRFAFLGTTRSNKGVEVLAAAIPLLARDVRRRCHITIRAHGWEWPLRKRLARFPEVTVYGGYDLYQLIGAAGEYDVGLLPHIWLENSPLVMLEHLHAGKFMVASRLGGPPDWIVEGKNGMLFTAGRPDELAACMTRLVTGEVAIPSPREVHEASTLRSYPDHVREVERVYREALGEPDEQSATNGLRNQPDIVTVREQAAISRV
jgi:GT2 family glycosyltransferase